MEINNGDLHADNWGNLIVTKRPGEMIYFSDSKDEDFKMAIKCLTTTSSRQTRLLIHAPKSIIVSRDKDKS